jgi:hypothetical protein
MKFLANHVPYRLDNTIDFVIEGLVRYVGSNYNVGMPNPGI